MYDFDDSLVVWVGDLDSWVNLDFSHEYEAERKEKALQAELDKIGEIPLFSQKSISSRTLQSRGISPKEWRWSLHEAQKTLSNTSVPQEVERLFLKKLTDMGRGYAIRRYARWENLPYSAALTATFPHGIRALLYQYIDAEPSLRAPSNRPDFENTLYEARNVENLTAYDKTALVRETLHDVSRKFNWPEGHYDLNKDRTRKILSLCRLYFLVLENRVRSLKEVQDLDGIYCDARNSIDDGSLKQQAITGKKISNWKKRHQHSLFFFFPFSIRNAIKRSCFQLSQDQQFNFECAVNEISLVICSMKLMRQDSIDRRKSK